MKLVVFLACYTGAGGRYGYNLPSKIVDRGATVAIGFQGELECNAAKTWIVEFFEQMGLGYNVNWSVSKANDSAGIAGDDVTVSGDDGYCFGD